MSQTNDDYIDLSTNVCCFSIDEQDEIIRHIRESVDDIDFDVDLSMFDPKPQPEPQPKPRMIFQPFASVDACEACAMYFRKKFIKN